MINTALRQAGFSPVRIFQQIPYAYVNYQKRQSEAIDLTQFKKILSTKYETIRTEPFDIDKDAFEPGERLL